MTTFAPLAGPGGSAAAVARAVTIAGADSASVATTRSAVRFWYAVLRKWSGSPGARTSTDRWAHTGVTAAYADAPMMPSTRKSRTVPYLRRRASRPGLRR